jgi:hypothetical protein
MPPRWLISFSSLALALAALGPAAALGAAKGTDRPLKGTETGTTILDIAAGTGTANGSGQLSHLGGATFTTEITSFTLTGPGTFSLALSTIVGAANGDEVFASGSGTGTLTPTGSEATLVLGVSGGTGRFADASGTITTNISGATVSVVGPTLTIRDTATHRGRISY